MTAQSLQARPPRHYPTPAAKCADLVVHVVGLTLAMVGGAVLLALAVQAKSISLIVGVAIYAAGLLAMLAFSTAYNFAKPAWRPKLRRLDHAGIFLMIAGSYTPFTTQLLEGAWSVGMTAAVWSIAGLGVLGKLFLGHLDRKVWVVFYLALGWIVVIALRPLASSITWGALVLLAVGGVLYSTGVAFYVNKRLKFARAIWHGHVVAAASAHWAAVLLGVVLASR
ncbi:MAG: hemolysin III family protein [Phenylobacterium sp.]|jgi:hemolysin III|uniref:PAQR family membrane homeostasis protein TrhA n=1 Tax=Phenylobacterium sp. TaxID=1871053 RepID=UPI002A2BD242|nr:hemolysin III family protein [Phenylobacterium sp.]MDD3838108.1 hemolysin III family protein [Phenylobacterium sp.]MDX9999520.1 hemolysin III family protein [Phenylobacterium sp.]